MIVLYVIIYLVIGAGVCVGIDKIGRNNCATYDTVRDMQEKDIDHELDEYAERDDLKSALKSVGKLVGQAFLMLIVWPIAVITSMISLMIMKMRE